MKIIKLTHRTVISTPLLIFWSAWWGSGG